MKKIEEMTSVELESLLYIIREMIDECKERNRYATFADNNKPKNDIIRFMGELEMGCYVKGEDEHSGVFVLKDCQSPLFHDLRTMYMKRRRFEMEMEEWDTRLGIRP